MNNKKQEQLLNLDIINTIIFIGTVFVSLFLTINEKRDLEGKSLISGTTNRKINIYNRIVAIIVVFVYIYINYSNYTIAKKRGKNTRNLKLQLFTNVLTLIAAFIVLYIVYTNESDSISSIENPNI